MLQKSKEHGVLEIELFDDWEKPGNVRVIKHRLNKIIGDDAVRIVTGRWYLSSHYWQMSRSEFIEFLNRSDLIHMNHKNNMMVLAMVGVFSVLLVGTHFISYNLGVPNSLTECGYLFGVDINLDE